MRRALRLLAAALLALGLAACEDDPTTLDAGEGDAGATDAGVLGPTSALSDYASEELYAAPWPDERLRNAEGNVDVSAFPNPRRVAIVRQLLEILTDARGFGLSSTIYFPMNAGVDPSSLPDLEASITAGASVFLMDVDPDSPDRGARWPVDVAFLPDPGDFGAENLIALLPLQGRPLYPSRLYAAVVTTSVLGEDGTPVGVAAQTTELLAGSRPSGMGEAAFAAHTSALEGLRGAGVDDATIAATAVFRTWDPAEVLVDAYDQVHSGALPTPDATPTLIETYDDFCVYSTTIGMPDFQSGVAPYSEEGGSWTYDDDGQLVLQRTATSNLYVTVPRRAMPDSGFGATVFSRTGGGGDRPLIDRGPRAEAGAADTPGTGPAVQFARAGFAGVQVDGPLGGLRNTDGWDEQFAVFNIVNPFGLRDNIRQSALELTLLPGILSALSFDASDCGGFSSTAGDSLVRFDSDHFALMGHSMGATITPLTAALEPGYEALILSGAGGSWIENVIFKKSPIEVRPLAEAILLYSTQGRSLSEHDPALALLQWAGEEADPQVYARWLVTEPRFGDPRNVLMFQGILDTYIPPPIANSLSLALDLDLAGGALDESVSDRYVPLTPLFAYTGGERVALPASGNRASGAATAVVVQQEEDGIEDGHEVVFQTSAPPVQYRCFLDSLLDGVPIVVARDATDCSSTP